MANQLCDILKYNSAFEPCRTVVDTSFFIDSCKYDICSDDNPMQRDLFLCSIVSAYTFECANKGILLNWYNQTDAAGSLNRLRAACVNSFSTKCTGGSSYSYCARIVDAKCPSLKKQLDNKSGFNCIAGCSCPDNEYFDRVNDELVCVPKEACSCYHYQTKKFYQPNERILNTCSSW